jgi:hypothetical protein
MKTLILLTIVFSLYACYTIKENNMSEEPFFQKEDIQFEGNQQSRKDAIELLDKVLKEQGDLGVYGNLSIGLERLTKEFYIEIKDEKDYYSIDIYPKSYAGHDFSFSIDKNTGKISDLCVGEIIPPPTEDNEK